MKKLFPIYVRVPLLLTIFYFLVEFTVDSGDQPSYVKYPIILVLYGLFVLILISIEVLVAASNKILNAILTPEQRAEQEIEDNKSITESDWYKNLMTKLTRSATTEDEQAAIMTDHEYDGIKELDNLLPPWWVALFYITALFSVVYLAKYHVFGYDNQDQEYLKEVAQAEKDIALYKLTAPDTKSVDNVVLLTEPADLAKGKALYETNCVACHKADGGGSIGPNLTDAYWILGGDVKDVFNTIMEGGRSGKGMVPWKDVIKPSDIEKVASYVLSLQGTTPADGKAPEGELHAGAEATTAPAAHDLQAETAIDSASVIKNITE